MCDGEASGRLCVWCVCTSFPVCTDIYAYMHTARVLVQRYYYIYLSVQGCRFALKTRIASMCTLVTCAIASRIARIALSAVHERGKHRNSIYICVRAVWRAHVRLSVRVPSIGYLQSKCRARVHLLGTRRHSSEIITFLL